MKQILLLFLFLLFTFNTLEAQGPPPPCGYSPYFQCDEDGDGFAVFDLVSVYAFPFCQAGILFFEEDYNPLTYHETLEDAQNGINAISNPEAYFNIVANEQLIFFRAEKTIPDGNFDVLISEDFLLTKTPPVLNSPSPYIVCNSATEGFGTFNLTPSGPKNEEILGGQDFTIRYYETLSDAQNQTNSINSGDYINVTPFAQTIYCAASVGDCMDIVEMDLIVQGTCQDIAINLFNPADAPNPGFNHLNYIIIENVGSELVSSGTVEYILDSDLQFSGSIDPGTGNSVVVTGNSFELDFVNLDIGESLLVQIPLFCPPSTTLGTQIINTAEYTTSSEDVYGFNNSSQLYEIVVGSYDPNDKLESRGPTIDINTFDDDDFLYYTIRFQNLGTANAQTVRIEDVLDASLNPASFRHISASHDVSYSRTFDTLTWEFEDIDLPYADADEPNSHGYVYFKIKPMPGFSAGDIIPNTAAIYFDFNPPVITNTFETEFTDEQLELDTNILEQLSVFPNPSKGELNVKFSKDSFTEVELNLYSIAGQRMPIKVLNQQEGNLTLDVSNMPSGFYFLSISNNNKEVIKKIIVQQ